MSPLSSEGRNNSISLDSKVKNKLRPFLDTSIKSLYAFGLIESAIPNDIQKIYDEVVASRKWRYRRLIKRYRRYAAKIESHNAEIIAIMDRVDSIDLDELYKRTPSVSDEEARELYDFTSRAYRFYVPHTNPYSEKLNRLRVFASNIKTIRAQWDQLWKPFYTIQAHVNMHDGYISRDDLAILQDMENVAREDASRIKHPFVSIDSFPRVKDFVRSHNDAYLDTLASDPLFDDVGGVSLDPQQRRAALTPETIALVIAGAGSGKTTTICGRVRYLIERRGVNPSDILLLSYSKKSADDLAAKMALIDPSLSVGTFHKIGLDIIKAKGGSKPTVEEQWDAIIEDYFRDEMAKNPQALRNILEYYGLFLNNGETKKKYHSEGELFADLKKADFITFKESLIKVSGDAVAMETIKKERVKSFEEMAIANFYFINGIDYQYERAYEHDVSTPEKRQYTPDFYLKKYGIYHEHFGIDADGRAKQFDGPTEAEYIRGVAWKRNCHKQFKTKLIETYSSQFSDGTVFKVLEKKLKEMGVAFHPIGDETIRKALDSVYGEQSFKSFINLVKSFLSLYKARYDDASHFSVLKSASYETKYNSIRAKLFLTICEDIYKYYMERIRNEGKIDFDDMILQSIKLLPNSEGFRFKHIIVDEFQDISYSRMLFLKKLIEHGESSLFAVGDDWQSIYRFSGCDVNILLNFEKHFGPGERYFIGNVHRNSQQLQDIATRFIEANPEQIRKTIHADKKLEHPIRVIYYSDEGYPALMTALGMIAKKQNDAHVLLLGRNNKDISPFLTHRFYFSKGKPVSLDYPKLDLTYSTVHSSKGLEEDYVILLSASDSPNGFPNKTEDDPLLNLVMSESSKYPFAEERRLWYVALTRTRSYTLILVPANNQSSFIQEMEGDYLVVNPEEIPSTEGLIHCPQCKAGHLVLRQGIEDKFYGCSNYPYCRYSIDDLRAVNRNKRCPLCGDFMIFRRGRWGAFFGCHNYPRCDYTEEYVPGD